MVDYEKEIYNLRKLISNLIMMISRDKKYNGYDVEAGRVNTSKAQRSADDANTLAKENEGCILEVADVASENDGAVMDIAEIASENDSAILDVAMIASENDSAVMELAEYLANLESRIENLEKGENA